jgi:hypothetical protein
LFKLDGNTCIASAIDDALAEFNVEVRAVPVSPVHLVEQMDAADSDGMLTAH